MAIQHEPRTESECHQLMHTVAQNIYLKDGCYAVHFAKDTKNPLLVLIDGAGFSTAQILRLAGTFERGFLGVRTFDNHCALEFDRVYP